MKIKYALKDVRRSIVGLFLANIFKSFFAINSSMKKISLVKYSDEIVVLPTEDLLKILKKYNSQIHSDYFVGDSIFGPYELWKELSKIHKISSMNAKEIQILNFYPTDRKIKLLDFSNPPE